MIATLNGVLTEREGEAVVIQTAQPENVLRQLLQLDLDISGIEVSSAGLDEAFLALTRDDGTKRA